jgi:uncharacterized phage protein gp47/JayE
MPYPTPTLTTLQQQAVQDVQAAQITDASGNRVVGLFQKSLMRVLALVQAGFAYGLYGTLQYIAQQSTPWTATDEYAAGWAALKKITQKDATAATGTWTSGGTSTNGVTLPLGTVINRGSDGTGYTTTAVATVSGGVVSAPVSCNIAGSAGTITAGQAASVATPVVGIIGTGSFTAAGEAGADQETFAAFKTRYLDAFASPPQGGSQSDYVNWALGVSIVTRAWCIPNGAGAGTVQVYFMADIAEAAYGGFPQGSNGVAAAESRAASATGDQLAVANYIYPLRPVCALVYALAPTANTVNFTISGLVPATTAVRNAVTAALATMFLQVASPGGTTRPDGGTGGEIYPSDWNGAIESAAGVLYFNVTSPSSPVTSSTGAIPTIGTVTFT